ncbi:MAG: nitroreductase family protein [Fimbriimonadaceae bacterium]|nr:MAG: nitroreductase family protein [Fimbriimonadaceae bacterium]
MKPTFPETAGEAWVKRYGSPAPEGLPDLAPFLSHRSVRRFAAREVPEVVVAALVAAAQSASTSSNLQLWSVVSIQDPERRERVAKLCADQVQVREAGWFFAFLADHYRIRRAASAVGEATEGSDYNEFFTMAVIDAALATERLLCAAESIGLAGCYIGALRNDPEGIAAELGLPSGTAGLFGLCLGYPAEPLTAEIKPRLAQESIWFRETYDQEVAVADYDERMGAFYREQNMKGDVTWSMRSGRRMDEAHVGTRKALKPFLQRQGFDRR